MIADLLDQYRADLRALMTAYSPSGEVGRIAVVGNAPMAPDDERADEIDSADLVLRVNSFVMDEPGRPRVQGSRVDVVVFNRLTRPTRHLFHRYPERLYLLAEQIRLHGTVEPHVESWPADLGAVPISNREIEVLNEALGYDWRELRLGPTTGFTAAWLALTIFPEAETVLTGFSMMDDPQQTSWQHQWGDSCPVGTEHRIDYEGRLMARWVANGQVRWLPRGEVGAVAPRREGVA